MKPYGRAGMLCSVMLFMAVLMGCDSQAATEPDIQPTAASIETVNTEPHSRESHAESLNYNAEGLKHAAESPSLHAEGLVAESLNHEDEAAENEIASFQAELLIQQPKPLLHTTAKEEKSASVVFKGESRFGALTLESAAPSQHRFDADRASYSGDFQVVYDHPDGNRKEIAQLTGIQLLEDLNPWQWSVIPLEQMDLFVLQNDQTEYYKDQNPLRSIRVFAITENLEALPLSFSIDTEGTAIHTAELTVQSDLPIAYSNEQLILFSPVPQMHKLAFAIDIAEGQARLVQAENIQETYRRTQEIAEEQAKILEQILFYGIGENVFNLDEESWMKLKTKVSPQAAQRKSYQYMLEHAKTFPRAFYWGISDVRLNEQEDQLSFTLSMNVFYAIGQDMRLEVYMERSEDDWIFADFGSLSIEHFAPGGGVIIREPVKTVEPA